MVQQLTITTTGGTTNQSTETITGTGTPGDVVTLFDNGANGQSIETLAATVNGSGNWSAQLDLAPGTNTISAVDAVEVVKSNTITLTFNPLSITTTGGTTNHSTQTITGTGTPSDVVTFYDNGANGQPIETGTVTVNGSGNWSAQIDLAPGTNTISAVDAVEAVQSNTITFTYNPLSITTAGGTTNQSVQTITGTGTPGDLVTWYDSDANGLLTGTVTVNGSGNWSAQIDLAPGTNTISAVDAVEAVQSNTITLTYNPISITTAGAATNRPLQIITGTGRPGDEVNLIDQSTSGRQVIGDAATVNSSGNWSAQLDLASGINTIVATDSEGDQSNAVAIVLSPLGITTTGGTTNQSSQTITGTGKAGDNVSFYDNGTLVGTVAVTAGGNWSGKVDLVAGANTISASDPEGDQSNTITPSSRPTPVRSASRRHWSRSAATISWWRAA
jgi:hypothetical protein